MRRAEHDERPAEDEVAPAPIVWSQLAQDTAITLWPAFLAAAVATMFFFAFFDPTVFGEGAVPPRWLTHRMAGYAVGFFFFWAICTLSSALTLYMVRTARQQGGGRARLDERTREAP